MRIVKESQFKRSLIFSLDQIKKGWESDDLLNTGNTTTDLVNKSLKIAIEIKDVFRKGSERFGLKQVREQFKRAARGANKKFRNYPDFRLSY